MSFDIAMPLTLFVVTLVSVFLNQKTEGKLKATLEDREFRVRDVALFVGMMAVMIALIVFVRQMSLVLMILFLFSYSLLLFTFGYVFSKNRWYVGAIPPAVFILLYVFFRDSEFWAVYLVNVYGLVFAVLITLYLAGLFSWKTTAVFAVLLTVLDIFLVLVTGTMVEAAKATSSLNLPVLVSLPTLPAVVTAKGSIFMRLGLGDFFFAGLLAIQTFKKFGRNFAVVTVIAMTVSFSIFEAALLTLLSDYGFSTAFPGTLMIICGWAPLILWKKLRHSHTETK